MLSQPVKLKSSNLESAAYDDDSATLVITFKTGDSYQYENVPRAQYDGMLTAASPGAFFAANIKGRYRFIKL